MNDVTAARGPVAPVLPRPGLGYEFNPMQEAAIASLSRLMHIVGAASVVFALLGLLALRGAHGAGGIVILAQSTAMIVIGILTFSVGTRFGRIASSSGADIKHLMEAIGGLRTMYLIQVWAIVAIVAIVAGLLVILLLNR